MAHESRLKILGRLAGRECSVEELAFGLGLKAPTISHHLTRLREAGLVRMRAEGSTHHYRLDDRALASLRRELLRPERMADLADQGGLDAWERKVLSSFFEGERLVEIPASRKKRQVVL
ncbi:MAG: metalloregulator ArsR/SmtB family transcription factor, partial [Proteobacteria bacterium]|nr:metalloregulator ArsR/SmtB family transcription factor [Pseudomonadota bacterium]